MKSLILMMVLAGPVSAEWGGAESAAAGALAERAEVSVIGGAPLLDLLAARYEAALPLEIGGNKFLATVMFDAEWETWFVLKPEGCGAAGAWKEAGLAAGVVFRNGGREIRIRKAGDVVTLDAGETKAEVSMNGLFDLLYRKSMKVTFGGIITYAVFRNLTPLTEDEGTATMRLGQDGLYYFSVTPDRNIEAAPRWLLAVNGVLYGLRVEEASLLFVSKPIEMPKPFAPAERVLR